MEEFNEYDFGNNLGENTIEVLPPVTYTSPEGDVNPEVIKDEWVVE